MNGSYPSPPVFLWLVVLGWLGTNGVGAEGGPPRPSGQSSMPVASDSRRVAPEELEQLLPDTLFNAKAETAMWVNGAPVLTDRGSLHVSAAEFGPTDTAWGGSSEPEYWNWYGWVSGGNHHCTTYAVAPVYLPEGVTVDFVLLTAEDDSTQPLDVYLSRRLAFGEVSETMSFIQTDTDLPGVRAWIDSTIDHTLIRNFFYQYDLLAGCLDSEKRLRSVFIYYSY